MTNARFIYRGHISFQRRTFNACEPEPEQNDGGERGERRATVSGLGELQAT